MEKPDICSICIQIEQAYGKGRMVFNLPDAILDTPQRKAKKIICLIIKHAYQDEDLIPTLDDWFEYLEEKEKNLWEDAGRTFQEQFVLPEQGKNQKERQKIRARNNRMYEDVKRHKATYEKVLKRKGIYEEMKGAGK